MINKILAYFPDSVTQDFAPSDSSLDYHWFKETEDDRLWIGIPKNSIQEDQLELMKALYHHHEPDYTIDLNGRSKSWYQFLFEKGIVPDTEMEEARIIQFRFHGSDSDHSDLSEALQGFLPDHLIIWHQEKYGVIIEQRMGVIQTQEELESISSTFESDFFIKMAFYVGKFKPVDEYLPAFFEQERQMFHEGMSLDHRTNVYHFENIFPLLLSSRLPESAKYILEQSIIEAFREDRELMSTIKVFLESNSNVSHAAKQLYVHRNTLQYRIDKFTEKTGINLKDFDSAVMVYLACLYADKR